jgi:hypothetical protein
VTADNNNGNGGQQQRQSRTTTVVDDNGMQDRPADYEGEGGERVANNNSIRARRAESVKKIKKLSLCKKTSFSNTVSPVVFFTPTKTPNVWF